MDIYTAINGSSCKLQQDANIFNDNDFTVNGKMISINRNSVLESVNNRVSTGNCSGLQITYVQEDSTKPYPTQFIDGDLETIYDENTLIDCSNRFPWSEIKTVTVDNQQYIKVPKMYISSTFTEGKSVLAISKYKKEGYHCAPSFMRMGVEMPYILISQETFNTSITVENMSELVSNFSSTGRLYSIYDAHLLARLVMIESQCKMLLASYLSGDTIASCSYINIKTVFNNSLFYDGIRIDSDRILSMHDNQGYQQYVKTLESYNYGGSYQLKWRSEQGESYNMSDIFIPSIVRTSNENQNFFGGYINCPSVSEEGSYKYARGTQTANAELNGPTYVYFALFNNTKIGPYKIVRYDNV